jgi:uncharacterized FAD-dependent dehydrogenase
MEGFAGAGGFSDGKLTYHHEIGGQLSKYCGIEKSYDLMDQAIEMWKRFHPDPDKIMLSNPTEEPDFIKPYFNLRLFPVYHIGTDYLKEIGKNWYEYLLSKGVKFIWKKEITDIDFKYQYCVYDKIYGIYFDKLIFAVGKSGINFSKDIINKYKLPTEPKSIQLGVRFEAPQHYFQKLIDISYDFKLYRKYEKEGISIRSFCVNNNAAYIAEEETYGDITYNGHAKKDPKYENNMTNFGIMMEIQNIKEPYGFVRQIVKSCQEKYYINKLNNEYQKVGLYYSPEGTRQPSTTSEGNQIKVYEAYNDVLDIFKEAYKEYSQYILDFIEDLNKIFNFGNDYGMYIPEVKYLSEEPLVNYENLSLINYPDVYFVGDTLSARGITCSGAQGIYAAESILKNK